MNSYGTCLISLLSVGLSLRFLLKISLISTYKMPPCLLSNLLKALRYSSGNIQKFGILHSGCLADTSFSYANEVEVMSQPHLHTKMKLRVGHAASMENWQFFKFSPSNFSVLLSDNKPNEVASFSP